MRRGNNFSDVRNMRKLLSEMKKLTLERYILPEEMDDYDDEESFGDEEMPRRQEMMPQSDKTDISGIEKELTQIRKISLSVIQRLADQPTSPQYDTMKKIWNMVDKAIEQPQKGNENYPNQ